MRTRRQERDDEDVETYLTGANSLPYPVESLEEMHQKLDVILSKLVTAIEAKDFEVGVRGLPCLLCVAAQFTLTWTVDLQLPAWTWRLECWMSMKAPMKREVRVALTKLCYNIIVLPGMDPRVIEPVANLVRDFGATSSKASEADHAL